MTTATLITLDATSANAQMYAAVATADFDTINVTEYTVEIAGDLPLTHNFLVGIGVNVGYIDLDKPFLYVHDTGGRIVLRTSDGFGHVVWILNQVTPIKIFQYMVWGMLSIIIKVKQTGMHSILVEVQVQSTSHLNMLLLERSTKLIQWKRN